MAAKYEMPTTIDKEVALASAAQGLAPAGAMPPLMVGMLVKSPQSKVLIGAPAMPGVHARAADGKVAFALPPATPEQDAFSESETKRRLKVGGFYDTGRTHDGINHFDEMQIAAISGDHMAYLGEEKFDMYAPQIPSNMTGLKGASANVGVSDLPKQQRWQRGSELKRD